MTEAKCLTVDDLYKVLAGLPGHFEVWIDDSNRHFSAPVVGTESLLGSAERRVYLFPSK